MEANWNGTAPSETVESVETVDLYSTMFEMISAFKISQVIRAACVHSLADHLDKGLNTLQQISAAASLNVDATNRLLRACVSIGLMTHDSRTHTYAATPLFRTLLADDPGSLRSYALAQTGDSHWLPWGRLDQSVKSGEQQAVATLGCSIWEHFRNFPAEAAIFSDAMKGASVAFDREVGKLVDTSSIDTAVDIGGASGSFVHALMEANHLLRGVVFDLPTVVAGTTKAELTHDVKNRLKKVPGDFFTDVLPPADLYLLKLVLHDWDDDACLRILRNCRRSIKVGGRLVVAEMVVGEPGALGFKPLIDLTMLVVLGGKERSIEEFRALFVATGFRLTSVKPTSTRLWLMDVEAV